MTIARTVTERITAFCEANRIPGFVAGLHDKGERTVVAHGIANLNTGAPMRADTGFLFGSITKIMTTTLVMQQVEKGTLDLDAPVAGYLPVKGEGLRVRHLLNATSGIDADLFFPDEAGRDALKIYVDRLGRECGTLFPPGRHVSYSNGGMIVAGRLLEVVTGLPYHDLLERDVFAAAGMGTACTGAGRAILRNTAIGHFDGRPTGMFMLPQTWGPAGGTPIGTVDDLLAFGRAYLDNTLLSRESVALMQTVTADPGTPNSAPIGLGWLVRSMAGTPAPTSGAPSTVLTMSGASPGGVAVLVVIPERDLVFAAYGNDPRSLELHDALLDGIAPEPKPTYTRQQIDVRKYAGTYRSNQLRIDVRVVDGELEEEVTYEPADASQKRIFTGFVGGPFEAPPTRYVPIGPGLFAPAGLPLDALPPHYIVSYHDGAAFRCSGGRMTRRV